MDRSKVPQNSVLLAADDNSTSNLSKKGLPGHKFAPRWLWGIRYINSQTLDTITNILRRSDLDELVTSWLILQKKNFKLMQKFETTWTLFTAFYRNWNIVTGNMTQIHESGDFVATNNQLYLRASDNIATLAICLCLYRVQNQWKEDTQENSIYICL